MLGLVPMVLLLRVGTCHWFRFRVEGVGFSGAGAIGLGLPAAIDLGLPAGVGLGLWARIQWEPTPSLRQ